jgi:transcriptional regulator with XRE-family HTH domain
VLYPELVGLVLRRYRDRAQLRQADLAVELAWAQPKISRLERGDSYLTVDQLQGIVAVLNQKLPLVGEDPIGYWTVLAHADQLAQDLVVLEYDVTFCTGPEWAGAGALLRGDQLRAALALAHVPFSP